MSAHMSACVCVCWRQTYLHSFSYVLFFKITLFDLSVFRQQNWKIWLKFHPNIKILIKEEIHYKTPKSKRNCFLSSSAGLFQWCNIHRVAYNLSNKLFSQLFLLDVQCWFSFPSLSSKSLQLCCEIILFADALESLEKVNYSVWNICFVSFCSQSEQWNFKMNTSTR